MVRNKPDKKKYRKINIMILRDMVIGLIYSYKIQESSKEGRGIAVPEINWRKKL